MEFSSFESGAVAAAHNDQEVIKPVDVDVSFNKERFTSPDTQAQVILEQELFACGFDGMETPERIEALKAILDKYHQIYMNSVNADTPEKIILKFNSYHVLEAAAKALSSVELAAAGEEAKLADWARQYSKQPA